MLLGEEFVLALCGGQRLATLDEYRYYNRNIAIKSMSARLTLAALPPTSAAAREHSKRTYLQVQQWSGRDLMPTHSYRFTRCTSESHKLQL